MHLTELEIAAFIEKKSSKKQREKVLNHLSICEECYDNFAEVCEILKDMEKFSPQNIGVDYIKKAENLVINTPHIEKNYTNKIKLGFKKYAFVLAVVAFGLSILLFKTEFNVTSVKYRSANNITTLQLLTPQDLSVNNLKQLKFRWKSIRESKYYLFKLYDTIGNTVWEKSTKNIHIELTKKVKLTAGKKYLWQVIAFLDNGKKISSKLYAFTYTQ